MLAAGRPGADPEDWLGRLAETPWVDLFDALMAEVDRNDKRHRQNTSRINRFFMNFNDFSRALGPVHARTRSCRVERIQSHQMTAKMRLLDPTIRFTFDTGPQNILADSDKHLMVDRRLVNALRCAAIGCRRVAGRHPGAKLSVSLEDKALWVSCTHDDEAVLARWSRSEDAVADEFVELHDLSREMSVERVRALSGRGGIVFAGYSLCFRFQQVLAQVRERHRLASPLLLSEGSPDAACLETMRLAVDACERLSASYPGHRFSVLATGGALIVEAKIAVEPTWQDTTAEEQDRDEGRLEGQGG